MPKRTGRKQGFSFGRPVLRKTIRISDDHKARAALLATEYHTADEILRSAIERGLREIEIEAEQKASKDLSGNSADW